MINLVDIAMLKLQPGIVHCDSLLENNVRTYCDLTLSYTTEIGFS